MKPDSQALVHIVIETKWLQEKSAGIEIGVTEEVIPVVAFGVERVWED